ncbi:DUF4190 domain-containing protein [Tsukamurella sp. PLM1]|uniref:DUF4190 domain-containing protein n=1 Tax=Tsukamurella sp. PLM1 TaxID=2929795 RepID=UPI002068908A|nr:DUF4190 domain-containing protein [Tsukamurella sp. PLM1]BDH56943.1 hypothetical protein MTP03_18820 [Tsukamurella sp. PLM1]
MTSNDPQQSGDGTYDPTVIRPVEPAPPAPDLTKRDDDATQIANPVIDGDAATTVHNTATPDPYAAPEPYPAPSNPYAAQPDPYAAPSNPYAAQPDPYAAPPQYPGPQQYPGQQGFGQQPFGQQLPGYPAYPGQNAPGFPGYGQPMQTGTNGLAIASLICGVVSMVLFCFWGAGLLVAIPAVVMGVLAMKQIRLSGQEGHGMALAGVITGSIGLVISLCYLILVIIGLTLS